jgi:hypothetical protein
MVIEMMVTGSSDKTSCHPSLAGRPPDCPSVLNAIEEAR